MGADFLTELGRAWTLLADLLAFDPMLLSDPAMVVRLLLFALLLLASAFFSSAETALFGLSRLELRELRRERHPQADTIHALLDQPRRLIISVLCGNELINVAATANMASILLVLYPAERVVAINMLLMVPLLLLFGEVTPKTIAVTNPVLVSTRISAPPMAIWVRLVAPLRWLVRLVAERVTRALVGPERQPENILQTDEFRTMVEEVVESGELHALERVLIDNILEAGSTEVVEIMVPRTRMEFIESRTPLAEVVNRVRQLRLRRLPVYRDNRDALVGILHAEDLVPLVRDNLDLATHSLESMLHPVAAVPPTMRVDELFNFFLHQETRSAIVLNEFGGVDGQVSLNSVIDFIFGRQERDVSSDQAVIIRADGCFEVDGALKLNHFNELLNVDIDDERMTTVAGLVLRHLERLPAMGDSVELEAVQLQVLGLEGHRIARVLVIPAGCTPEPGGDQGAAVKGIGDV